jgi:hypothetical protein
MRVEIRTPPIHEGCGMDFFQKNKKKKKDNGGRCGTVTRVQREGQAMSQFWSLDYGEFHI